MSFDTTHTSLDSDSDSDSTSDSSDATTTDHRTTSESTESSDARRRAIPGSPWRNPIRLEDPKVDADVLGQSLRNLTRKRIRTAETRSTEEEAGNALYVKGSQEVPLESRIESTSPASHSQQFLITRPKELYYIENAYGHEIFPDPNGEMIKQLQAKETLVYSCGSLWTRCVGASPLGLRLTLCAASSRAWLSVE